MSNRHYQIAEHCCRICGGRLLVADPGEGPSLVRCAECGHETLTDDILDACPCGIRLASGTDARLRCTVNDRKTSAMPNELLVTRLSPVTDQAEAAATHRRPVNLPDW